MTKQEIKQVNSALRFLGVKWDIQSIFKAQAVAEKVIGTLKPLGKKRAAKILRAVAILHDIELKDQK